MGKEYICKELDQGYVFIYVYSQHKDLEKAGIEFAFQHLDSDLLNIANSLEQTPFAYIETEYSGGTGVQIAAVWHQGKLLYGPMAEGNDWVHNDTISPTRMQWQKDKYVDIAKSGDCLIDDSPINTALRMIGAVKSNSIDKFQAVGLQKYRRIEI